MITYLQDFASRYAIDIRYRRSWRDQPGRRRLPAAGPTTATDTGAAGSSWRPGCAGLSCRHPASTWPRATRACRSTRGVPRPEGPGRGQGELGFEVVNAIIDNRGPRARRQPEPGGRWRGRTGIPATCAPTTSGSSNVPAQAAETACWTVHIQDIRRDGDGFVVCVSYVHADGEEETLALRPHPSAAPASASTTAYSMTRAGRRSTR